MLENLNIRKITANFIGTALIMTCVSPRAYKTYCRYCRGWSEDTPHVPVAEQLLNKESLMQPAYHQHDISDS
jgi:hypothetical protein